ncbi:MAG: TolC family outer membrane protein [Terricaulis sp.]
MRTRLLSAAALAAMAICGNATAETLPEALTDALQSNPALSSQRAQLNAVRQELPLAWSEALPQISGSASANRQQTSESNFLLTVRQQPEYWIGTINSSTLLFGSGRVYSATNQARAQIASAVASYDNAAQDLMMQVVSAYGSVIFARSAKDAQERALANLQEQLRYVQANVDHGFLTRTDLAQAQARVEQARAGVAGADADLVQANETYLRLVGHPAGELETPDVLPNPPSDLETALDVAGRENPKIVAAESDVAAARAAIGVAAAQGRARVTFETSDSVFGGIDNHRFRDGQSEDTLSVRVTVPFFSGGANAARTRQQNYRHAATQYDLADTERKVHEDVSVAWANVAATRTTVTSSQSRLEAAELAQRGMVREQQAGLRTTIDVLNQEQELLSARVDLARAQRDALVADRQMAATMGRLAVESLPNGPVTQASGEASNDHLVVQPHSRRAAHVHHRPVTQPEPR